MIFNAVCNTSQNFAVFALFCFVAACGRGDHIGKPPSFSNPLETREHSAMVSASLPLVVEEADPADGASLWSGQRTSLLGDRRAVQRGDIMTVVIEIDERAEISNETDRSRSGTESLKVPQLGGLPQRLDEKRQKGRPLRILFPSLPVPDRAVTGLLSVTRS